LEEEFPRLHNTRWQLRSPIDWGYNCHAWAACDARRRWEPTPEWYWPKETTYTIEGFVEGFSALGYQPCDSPKYEFGYQKIAIYAGLWYGIPNFPKHTARQDVFGRGWFSKLGDLEDILHEHLEDLNGETYGKPAKFLRRTWWKVIVSGCAFRCVWHALRFWIFRRVHPHGI